MNTKEQLAALGKRGRPHLYGEETKRVSLRIPSSLLHRIEQKRDGDKTLSSLIIRLLIEHCDQ